MQADPSCILEVGLPDPIKYFLLKVQLLQSWAMQADPGWHPGRGHLCAENTIIYFLLQVQRLNYLFWAECFEISNF